MTDAGLAVTEPGWQVVETQEQKGGLVFVKLLGEGGESWWRAWEAEGVITLDQTQFVESRPEGKWINGAPATSDQPAAPGRQPRAGARPD